MKKLIESIKYWGQIFLLPIYWLSFLIPRDKHIWLFGSTFGRRFADNPRYFYLYINQFNKSEIRAIWISHKKKIVDFLNNNGYEAYHFLSLKGIWYCLRGKVYLFDNYSKDINFWLSNGAVKINLWHGIPLKKIQADNRFDKVRHPITKKDKFKYFLRRFTDEKPSHYVLTTSKFLIPIFSSAFNTKHVLISGYPRNDMLVSDKVENLLTKEETVNQTQIQERLNDLIYNSNTKKMVLYMPTFRQSETKFFDVIDIKRLQKFLNKNNILFCLKLHPKSKLKDQFDKISTKNIFVINADTDPYIFLKMADALVTDYSSVYFDFLLTGKPVVFFNYDLNEYLKNSRELYYDYEEFTPGKKVTNWEELKKSLIQVCNSKNTYEINYIRQKKRIINKVFDSKRELSSPMLVKDIKNIVNM